MSMIGLKVIHKTLGIGTIIEHKNSYITVEFETKTSGFVYPDAFEKFLTLENAEEQTLAQANKQGVLDRFAEKAAHCGGDVQLMPAGGDMVVPAKSSLGLVKHWNGDEDMPEMVFSGFEKALGEVDFGRKPVYDGEFISALKGSFATNIQIKQCNRELERWEDWQGERRGLQ